MECKIATSHQVHAGFPARRAGEASGKEQGRQSLHDNGFILRRELGRDDLEFQAVSGEQIFHPATPFKQGAMVLHGKSGVDPCGWAFNTGLSVEDHSFPTERQHYHQIIW
jgi:hypothetical protein